MTARVALLASAIGLLCVAAPADAADLATTRAWPNWVEGDEFRAIRDRTAAQRR